MTFASLRPSFLEIAPLLLSAALVCPVSAAAASRRDDVSSPPPAASDAALRSWLVLGPIPVPRDGDSEPADGAEKRAFAADLLAAGGGEATVRPSAGAMVEAGGQRFTWRSLTSPSDTIDLVAALEAEAPELVVAYASAEITAPAAGTRILGLGSDDAVKVWLNGELVHEHWAQRSVRQDDDLVSLALREGPNHLLLKVQNSRGGWGFTCRLVGADVLEEELVRGAVSGDVDRVTRALSHGAPIDGRGRGGLTALQAAKLAGWSDIAELLVAKGADAKLPMPAPEELVDAMLAKLNGSRASGVAVLAAKDGKVLFKKGYGLANVEHGVPVTPRTKFRIGSITKQFTAAVVLKLAEDGKLAVADKLTKFYPDYPRGDSVTLYHLLTHTSGIHSYTGKPDFMETVRVFVTPEDLIKSFRDDTYDFDPGAKWSYNNSGFFLLGHIVERTAGESFGAHLRRTIFAPLGMNDTGIHHWRDILDHEATGYSYEENELHKADDWDMSRAGGAGALYSTVEDLYLWNEGVFAGKVLSDESLKAAFTPVVTGDDEKGVPKEDGYGFGWMVSRLRGLREIGHGGGLHGFSSYLVRYPSEKFTAVALANSLPTQPPIDPAEICRTLAQLFLADAMAPRSRLEPAAAVSVADLEALVGRYDYGLAVLTVTREGTRLFAQLTGQPRAEIFAKSPTEFLWRVVEAEVAFVKDDKGIVSKAVHRQGGQTINAPRMSEVAVITLDAEALDAVVGKYDYGRAVLTVSRDGDHLYAQLTAQPKFEIFPSSETTFFWRVVNAQVTFVKDKDGKVTKAVHEQGGTKFDARKTE